MSTPRASGPRLRAFTLIELLTVIAIIGILASILIPVVGQVREKANQAHCGNNLRQIALAVLAYESENGVLPGPTRREVRSPLAGNNRAGATVPRENRATVWPGMNVCMSLLLEDYMGVYTEGDPGPFYCRSNTEGTRGDSRRPVYILMRNIQTVPPSFFGDRDGNHAPRMFPKNTGQIVSASGGAVGRQATELSQIWMVADIDDLIWTNHSPDPPMGFGPPHGGGRNMAFFDGHLEHVKAQPDGRWSYPAHSGQPESF
jgi:prepilin-type N-terminal cleavage/methylation domain-containing protein/prepilin-type processing-associated H-X9-DG protein